MAPESNFTSFSDPSTNVIAAALDVVSILSICFRGWISEIQGLHLPYDLDFSALEDEPLSHDIFRLPLPLHAPSFPPAEYLPAFFPEIPPDTPSTPGITQNLFHPLQTSHEISTLHPHTTVRDCPPFPPFDSQC